MWISSSSEMWGGLIGLKGRAYDTAAGKNGSPTIGIAARRAGQSRVSASFLSLAVEVQRSGRRIARFAVSLQHRNQTFANSLAQTGANARAPLSNNGGYVLRARSQRLPPWILMNPMKEFDRIISDEYAPLQDPEC
jgi:hypothetical protein